MDELDLFGEREKKTINVSIWVTPEVAEQLTVLSNEKGMDRSSFVRDCIVLPHLNRLLDKAILLSKTFKKQLSMLSMR